MFQDSKVFWVKFPTGYRIIMGDDELSKLADFFGFIVIRDRE